MILCAKRREKGWRARQMNDWKNGDTLDKYILIRRLHASRKDAVWTDVWKAVDPNDPTQFVVLKIRRATSDKEFGSMSCRAQNEVATLQACHPHQHIAKCLDFFRVESSGELVVVFPFYEHGSLVEYINATVMRLVRNPSEAKRADLYMSGLPTTLVHRLFVQMVTALSHMHSRGVVHRDLKLQNVCVYGPLDNVSIVLIDTEYSALVLPPDGVSYMYTEPCGTPAYAPFEIYTGDPYDPRFVDVWCLGVCMFIMLFGELPYHFEPDRPLKRFETPIVFPEPIDSNMMGLLTGMLTIDPEHRMDISRVEAHPAFLKMKQDVDGQCPCPLSTPRSNKSSSDGLSDSYHDEISSQPPSPSGAAGFESLQPLHPMDGSAVEALSPRSKKLGLGSLFQRLRRRISQRTLLPGEPTN